MSEDDKLDIIAAILAAGQLAGAGEPGRMIFAPEAIGAFLDTRKKLEGELGLRKILAAADAAAAPGTPKTGE